VIPPSRVWSAKDFPGFSGPALLDTHVWLWYLDGVAGRLSPDAIELLRRCVRGEGVVISDISVWELGMRAAKGQLELRPDPRGWVDRASRRPGFSFMPLDRDILLRSNALPGEVHGDPADRMLMASAALSGLPLLTADPLIIEYAAREGCLSVCDVRGSLATPKAGKRCGREL